HGRHGQGRAVRDECPSQQDRHRAARHERRARVQSGSRLHDFALWNNRCMSFTLTVTAIAPPADANPATLRESDTETDPKTRSRRPRKTRISWMHAKSMQRNAGRAIEPLET